MLADANSMPMPSAARIPAFGASSAPARVSPTSLRDPPTTPACGAVHTIWAACPRCARLLLGELVRMRRIKGVNERLRQTSK
jgi:hypothetical protein